MFCKNAALKNFTIRVPFCIKLQEAELKPVNSCFSKISSMYCKLFDLPHQFSGKVYISEKKLADISRKLSDIFVYEIYHRFSMYYFNKMKLKLSYS